ncbi:MAG: hypothetical protein JW943_17295 [Deltaproteobacteria bacterium]|nr:hypothetical protein [Deltaproteobacteria bacterium]
MEQPRSKNARHPHGVRIAFWVLIGILTALAFAAFFAVVVTFLWNWLMTDLFGLKAINYYQAFGLVLLARLLVGGWHKGHHDEDHSHFHGFFGKKKTLPSHDVSYDRDAFSEFWEEAGREAFSDYLRSRQSDVK